MSIALISLFITTTSPKNPRITASASMLEPSILEF